MYVLYFYTRPFSCPDIVLTDARTLFLQLSSLCCSLAITFSTLTYLLLPYCYSTLFTFNLFLPLIIVIYWYNIYIGTIFLTCHITCIHLTSRINNVYAYVFLFLSKICYCY